MMRHIVYIPVDRHHDREGEASCDGCQLRMENDRGKYFCPFRRSPIIEWTGLAPHSKCQVWAPGARLEYREE